MTGALFAGIAVCDTRIRNRAAQVSMLAMAVVNCIGIGFQRGTHTRWHLVVNDGISAPTLSDMGASFDIATGGVLTLFIAAPPNGGSVWVRVVDEVSGTVFEQEISADLPASTQFLSPRYSRIMGRQLRRSSLTARGSMWRRIIEPTPIRNSLARLCARR